MTGLSLVMSIQRAMKSKHSSLKKALLTEQAEAQSSSRKQLYIQSVTLLIEDV